MKVFSTWIVLKRTIQFFKEVLFPFTLLVITPMIILAIASIIIEVITVIFLQDVFKILEPEEISQNVLNA